MNKKVCKYCDYWCGFGCTLSSDGTVKGTDRFDSCGSWKARPKDLLITLISDPNEIVWDISS